MIDDTIRGDSMTCFKPNFMYIDKMAYPKVNRFVPHSKMNDNFFNNLKDFRMGEHLYPIPCGQCIGCRLDYSRNWANRAYLESLNYKYNYFITFTYNDENIPVGSLNNYSLRYDDFCKFLKRLRIYYKRKFNHTNIKYMVCGEYGSNSFRPHYHAIFFNLPILDLSEDFKSIDEDGSISISQHRGIGSIYYFSQILNDIWSKGNILIGEATWQSMAYVSRYIVKKQLGPSKSCYDDLGIEPEFMHVSNGISKDYYLANKDKIYEFDNINVLHNKVVNVKPPKYFDYLMKKEDELFIHDIKKKRQESMDYITNIKLYSASFNELNERKEANKEIKAKSLVRVL